MKIIIVGCGKVGLALIEQLSKEGHDLTLIDQSRDVVESVTNKYDIMGMVGNGASYHVQVEAGIEESNLLIAVTESDELNLLCCMIAKKSSNCQTIARVRNPEYSQDVNSIKSKLGLAMVINPERAAAREAARLLRTPSAIKVDTFAKGRVELLKLRIEQGSVLHGVRLMELSHKLHCNVLVCAVQREDEVIIPKGNFVLQEKDIISIVASPKKADDFFRKIGMDHGKVRDAMIVGGGDLTYYLTEELLSMGINVTIIEKDMNRCNFLSEHLPKANIIYGDGSERQILEEEGLAGAEAFLSLTDMDEENIMMSLFAKRCSGAKLVTKINKIAFDDIISQLEIGSIICPKQITAENIVRHVRGMENSLGMNIESLYRIIEDKAEALEFLIQKGSPVIGIPLQEIKLKKNVLVCCINHGGQIITPRGSDVIHEMDTVIVVTTETGFSDIADILED